MQCYVLAGANCVKIGVSWDVRRRFDSIRTMSPVPLVLLGAVKNSCGGKLNRAGNLESVLHRALYLHRVHHEWFNKSVHDYLVNGLELKIPLEFLMVSMITNNKLDVSVYSQLIKNIEEKTKRDALREALQRPIPPTALTCVSRGPVVWEMPDDLK